MRAVLLLIAGSSLGFAFSAQSDLNIILLVFLILLACAGEWLEVQIAPLGTFTLRPVLALVGLWIGGPILMIIAGIPPVLLVRPLAKRTTLYEAVLVAGRDALALWVGYLTYLVTAKWTESLVPTGALSVILARVASFLGFWVAQIPLQALDLKLSEGIRFPAALRHLSRRATAHAVILTAAAVSLSYIGSNFGLPMMGIAAIVLIEAYYPWKLLGDQNGVLLTSVQMMAQAVDLKDPYTSNHSQRVSRYAVRIARAIGLPEDEVERIRIGGLMHDIGKIGISGRIIRKPGKLTSEEMALMMRHSSVSADIIEHLEILGESAEMVRHHHEHFDGSGYPDGLKGEEIPLGSRIILAADAFDAITTDRPYRKGASKTEAVGIIRKHAGTQFDTAVVDALERIAPSL
ncbi:MAG TPA: HD-GYP domain-containing protein [Nitrospiraceae bacterium]|nr:HD-GYP domain-containing protein [Nitrospiraceae bacterium]